MTLLDELCQIYERRKNDSEKERRILKMAICVLDNMQERPPRHPCVSFTRDEMVDLPGRWELIEGQLVVD